MGQCKSYRDGHETCGNETEPGFKFCTACMKEGKPKAVEEHTRKSFQALGSEKKGDDLSPRNEVVIARQNDVQDPANVSTKGRKNIVERVNEMLENAMEFEEEARTAYQRLELDDWSFTDKAGTAQLRPEVGVYERALDRAGRILPMIAKLSIEEQAAIIDKAQYEGVKLALTRTLVRLGYDDEQMKEVRRVLAEEFAKMVQT